jgi:transcriptional regulator with XRE-family HTH domain
MATKVDIEAVALGRAVRGAIAMAGLSVADTSERAGISLSTLSRRINGGSAFSIPELVRIAAMCRIRVSDIVLDAERIAERLAAETSAPLTTPESGEASEASSSAEPAEADDDEDDDAGAA